MTNVACKSKLRLVELPMHLVQELNVGIVLKI